LLLEGTPSPSDTSAITSNFLKPNPSIRSLFRKATPNTLTPSPTQSTINYNTPNAASCAFGVPNGTPNAEYFTTTDLGFSSAAILTVYTSASPTSTNTSLTCTTSQTPTSPLSSPVTIALSFVDSSTLAPTIATTPLQDKSITEAWDFTKWFTFDGSTTPPIYNNSYGYLAIQNPTSSSLSFIFAGRTTLTNNNATQPFADYSSTGDIIFSVESNNFAFNGSFNLYHNIGQIIATSTFNNLTFGNTNCSGNITTKFAASTVPNAPQPLPAFSSYVNATESLTIDSSCQKVTIVDVTGKSSTFSIPTGGV
jgi:hypothetical protein